MTAPLYSSTSGHITLPERVLCDRQDGGHLIVHPPRPVWERMMLTPHELVQWSLLVAATGRAMLECLSVLRAGCLNYWEAGNWALNEQAAPVGPKHPTRHRRVHLHVFGRSTQSRDPDWRWGESPRFPAFADAEAWSARFTSLSPTECQSVVERVDRLMNTVYLTTAHTP